jgi:hypothetical protein
MHDGSDQTTLLRTASAADPELGDLSGLLQLWEDRRKDRPLPARADFDPMDLRQFLGRIVLFDVLQNSRRFRFRLVGTDWVLRFGLDPTILWWMTSHASTRDRSSTTSWARRSMDAHRSWRAALS